MRRINNKSLVFTDIDSRNVFLCVFFNVPMYWSEAASQLPSKEIKNSGSPHRFVQLYQVVGLVSKNINLEALNK